MPSSALRSRSSPPLGSPSSRRVARDARNASLVPPTAPRAVDVCRDHAATAVPFVDSSSLLRLARNSTLRRLTLMARLPARHHPAMPPTTPRRPVRGPRAPRVAVRRRDRRRGSREPRGRGHRRDGLARRRRWRRSHRAGLMPRPDMGVAVTQPRRARRLRVARRVAHEMGVRVGGLVATPSGSRTAPPPPPASST